MAKTITFDITRIMQPLVSLSEIGGEQDTRQVDFSLSGSYVHIQGATRLTHDEMALYSAFCDRVRARLLGQLGAAIPEEA